MTRRAPFFTFLTVLSLSAAMTPAAAQQAAAPFPAGKQVSLYVGTDAGGTNDLLMRMVARHIGKYLPGNPTVVPRNMPGAGSRKFATYLYSQAPRDGTEFGVIQRSTTTDPLLSDPSLPFKMQELTWIGSPSGTTEICFVWHTAPFQTIGDVTKNELVLASTSSSERNSYILQQLAAAKVRTVVGYPGGQEMMLAVERGEVHGRCSLGWESLKSNYPEWISQNKVRVLLQFSFSKHADLPSVPLISDLAKTDIDRQALEILMAPGDIGYPFLAPPGLLPEVRDILRRAFDQTMKDPEYMEEAKKVKFDLYPVPGTKLQELVERIYAAGPAIIERAKQLGTPPK